MSSEVLFTPVAGATGWRINGERLWDSLMALAEIGATPKGGCCRLTLTDLDRQGRDVVIGWAQEAGMSVTVDKIGLPAGNLTVTTGCWRRWRWCVR